MAAPSVAVIIPVYNHVHFVERAVASVMAQTLRPTNVIMVDDNSTDGSYELLQTWEPRITLIRKPTSILKGPAASQNLALKMTTAKYVAFLDSDDVWMPEKLARQVAALEAHPEAGLCYCNGVAIDEDDRQLYQILPGDFRDPDSPSALLLDCFITTPSKVVVRRELFDRVGFFREDLLYSHDHECWVRMREVAKFTYVPDLLMAYRRHLYQGSLKREMWENGFLILNEASKRYPYGKRVYRKRWAVLRYRIGEYHWKQREAFRAYYNFVLSALADPSRALAEVARRVFRKSQRGRVQHV